MNGRGVNGSFRHWPHTVWLASGQVWPLLSGWNRSLDLTGSCGCADQPCLAAQTALPSSPKGQPSELEGGVHFDSIKCLFSLQFPSNSKSIYSFQVIVQS